VPLGKEVDAMSETAVLKIIVVAQGGLFLLVALLLWQKMDALRLDLVGLRKQCAGKVEVRL
jgi:hypothetical protein